MIRCQNCDHVIDATDLLELSEGIFCGEDCYVEFRRSEEEVPPDDWGEGIEPLELVA